MAKMSLAERAKAAAKKQLAGGVGNLYNRAWKSKKGLDSYKPEITKEDGSNRGILRIIPYLMVDSRNNPDSTDNGSEWYKRRWWQHRVGPNDVTVACLFKNFGKVCPACEMAKQLRSEGADEETVKKLYARERELYNVYDGVDKKAKLLDISTHLFGKKLLKEANDPVNEGAGEYVNPGDGGMNLLCRFDSEKVGTFSVTTLGDVKFKKSGAIPKEILGQAEDLDAALIELSFDDFTALMDGGNTTTPDTSSSAHSVAGTQVKDTPTASQTPDDEVPSSDAIDDLDF